ncbi:Telomerase Cajal body protein 1 [Thoreauomyces humboldtii]|nr:Telomerase Cajal body protein 1 [Thoreauomyces humboldtii]
MNPVQKMVPSSDAEILASARIYCGFNNLIQIFDVHRPGTGHSRRPTTPNKKSKKGQKGFVRRAEAQKSSGSDALLRFPGLISTIAFNPDFSGMYAAGSYAGSIGLYDERNDELLQQMKIPRDGGGRGVTQVEFSRDGNFLYSASRKADAISCWDIRNTGDVVSTLARKGNTNQRLAFSLDPSGRYLSTGDENGDVLIYDLQSAELVKRFSGHAGMSFSFCQPAAYGMDKLTSVFARAHRCGLLGSVSPDASASGYLLRAKKDRSTRPRFRRF